MNYRLVFPYEKLRFDFSNLGGGVAEITDAYGHKAKLQISVSYPYTADPSPRNLKITGAVLCKRGRQYPINPRNIRIEEAVSGYE